MGAFFVCDVHITPKLLTQLRAKGHDGDHFIGIDWGRTADKDIWEYARMRDAIVVSKDDDFARLSISRPGPRVILVRLGNCTNEQLLRRFDKSLDEILSHFESGVRLVELTW
jgi:predicted nuclease of predicted toxin-antitoxin system